MTFRPPLFAEFKGDAFYFASDREGCCVGASWHPRVVSAGLRPLGCSECSNRMLQLNQTKEIKSLHHYTTY